jgi:hypothetical protein
METNDKKDVFKFESFRGIKATQSSFLEQTPSAPSYGGERTKRYSTNNGLVDNQIKSDTLHKMLEDTTTSLSIPPVEKISWKDAAKEAGLTESDNWSTTTNKHFKKYKETRGICLADNDFNLFPMVKRLALNIANILPEDTISITNKLNGIPIAIGKVLKKRKLKWYESIFAPVDYSPTVYSDFCHIGSVVGLNRKDSKYVSLCQEVIKRLDSSLEPGITLYGEVVGKFPDGSYIKPKYDYGHVNNGFTVYVHNITIKTNLGFTYSLTYPQVQDYCLRYNLQIVPLLYYGKAKNLFPLPLTNDWINVWQNQFLQYLGERLNLDDKCDLCLEDVPSEGFVLIKENLFKPLYFKMKSSKFTELQKELSFNK